MTTQKHAKFDYPLYHLTIKEKMKTRNRKVEYITNTFGKKKNPSSPLNMVLF